MSAWEDAGQSDEWYTPKYIFDALGCRFDMDVAAPMCGPRHVPTLRWLWNDSLNCDWDGFVWMNPPYGARNGLGAWLDRFMDHGNGIALVPDRTSAPWFQAYAPMATSLLFVGRKIKFERPDGSLGKSPGCGSALLGVGEQADTALSRAADIGLLLKVFAEKTGGGK